MTWKTGMTTTCSGHLSEADTPELFFVLANNNIRIQKAFLFGSYAHGTFDMWSDIDIALVSEDFSGNRLTDKNAMRKIKLSISSDIDPRPYHPDDFKEDDPFVKEILQTGIRVV